MGDAITKIPHVAQTIKKFASYVASIVGVNPSLFLKFLFEIVIARSGLSHKIGVYQKGVRDHFGFTLGTNVRYVDPDIAFGRKASKLQAIQPTSLHALRM
jgi:hypothetical protein